MRKFLPIALIFAISGTVFGQISVDEAMARLRERQGKKSTTQSSTRPIATPTSRPQSSVDVIQQEPITLAALFQQLPTDTRPPWDEFTIPKACKWLKLQLANKELQIAVELKDIQLLRVANSANRDETIEWHITIIAGPARFRALGMNHTLWPSDWIAEKYYDPQAGEFLPLEIPGFSHLVDSQLQKIATPGKLLFKVDEVAAKRAKAWKNGDVIILGGSLDDLILHADGNFNAVLSNAHVVGFATNQQERERLKRLPIIITDENGPPVALRPLANQTERQSIRRPVGDTAVTSQPSTAATQSSLADATAAIEEFAKSADDALRSDEEKQPSLDACFSLILSHPLHISAQTMGVTGEVPIGEAGLFGDRPHRAILVSWSMPPRAVQGGRETRTQTAEVYLTAPDETLNLIEKGDNLTGKVTFTRGEVNPAVWIDNGRDIRYAALIKFLGEFTPDAPLSPRVPLPAKPDPLAPIVASVTPARQSNALPKNARIIFVCDASGSMITKFSTLRKELSSSIRQLSETQSFGIIFFQQATCVYLDKELILADPEDKLRADKFIETVTPRAETNPIPALDSAFKQRPDVIFLLTDGDFPEKLPVLRHIRELERSRKIKINTVAIGNDIDTHNNPNTLLRTIAAESGGVYRDIAD